MGIKTDSITNIGGGAVNFPQGFSGGPSFVPTGEWNGGFYSTGQTVSYQGSSYVAINDNSGDAPYNGNPNWQLMAQAGTNGTNGTDGSTGPQGPQGDPGPQGNPGTDVTPITNAYTDGNGNMYFQTSSGQTFGPYYLQGPQGPAGNNGSNGVDGAVQIYGTGGSYPLSNSFGSNPIYMKGLDAGSNISIYDNGSSLQISGSGISEAPNDGNYYARQNSNWTSFSPGGGISDAPYDGNTYGRNNGNWSTVGGGISGVDIYINGSHQGNYSSINFYDGPGSSSGNTIYLGN